MAMPGNPQHSPPGAPYGPPPGGPGFPPPARRRGKVLALAITLSVFGMVAVLGAGLVVLYVTGVIGPSKDDDAAESAPPEYSFDDELCDKIDFAAFGPELSRDGEVEAQPQDVKDGTGATSREQIDCWVMYDHVDGGTLLGQLSISMLYFPTEQEAVDHYGPSKMAPEVQDSAETYEGSWDEGLIGQYLWDTGSDVQTDAIFRDGNVFGYVRFYWSGGEWDPDQMTTGVKDLAEQLAVQLDR